MRSYLFVPGDDERKLAKAAGSGADALIVDLEDSVAPANKTAARQLTANFISANSAGGPALYVRVNPLTTVLTIDDLAAIMPSCPAGIVQPKARSAADAVTLSAMIAAHERSMGQNIGATALVILITETAAALGATAGYDAVGRRLKGLTWGAEDLSADLGATETRTASGGYKGPYEYARTMTLLAASAAATEAIDTVYPDFRDTAGFTCDCEEAVADGFTAKLAIHPAQVPIINEVFTPSAQAIAAARAVVDAFKDATMGVVSLDGQMLDRPHLLKAQRLLQRAGETQKP